MKSLIESLAITVAAWIFTTMLFAGDPIRVLWAKKYTPVATQLAKDYSEVKLLSAKTQGNRFVLRVKCVEIDNKRIHIFETYGKNFDETFDEFIKRAKAPDFMPNVE